VTYYQLPFTLPGTGTRRNADRTRVTTARADARKRFSNRWMLNASANLQSTIYNMEDRTSATGSDQYRAA
jgi:murein tripeptide amidase MpaA